MKKINKFSRVLSAITLTVLLSGNMLIKAQTPYKTRGGQNSKWTGGSASASLSSADRAAGIGRDFASQTDSAPAVSPGSTLAPEGLMYNNGELGYFSVVKSPVTGRDDLRWHKSDVAPIPGVTPETSGPVISAQQDAANAAALQAALAESNGGITASDVGTAVAGTAAGLVVGQAKGRAEAAAGNWLWNKGAGAVEGARNWWSGADKAADAVANAPVAAGPVNAPQTGGSNMTDLGLEPGDLDISWGQQAQQALQSGIDYISDSRVGSGLATARDAIGSGLGSARDAIGSGWNSAVNAAGNAWGSVSGAIMTTFGNIKAEGFMDKLKAGDPGAKKDAAVVAAGVVAAAAIAYATYKYLTKVSPSDARSQAKVAAAKAESDRLAAQAKQLSSLMSQAASIRTSQRRNVLASAFGA